jgi:hypothetical protein
MNQFAVRTTNCADIVFSSLSAATRQALYAASRTLGVTVDVVDVDYGHIVESYRSESSASHGDVIRYLGHRVGLSANVEIDWSAVG